MRRPLSLPSDQTAWSCGWCCHYGMRSEHDVKARASCVLFQETGMASMCLWYCALAAVCRIPCLTLAVKVTTKRSWVRGDHPKTRSSTS
jgi:hypothetical protein